MQDLFDTAALRFRKRFGIRDFGIRGVYISLYTPLGLRRKESKVTGFLVFLLFLFDENSVMMYVYRQKFAHCVFRSARLGAVRLHRKRTVDAFFRICAL